MKTILKKLTALFVCMCFVLTGAPVAFAGVGMPVDEAFYECAAIYPEFVAEVTAAGATERQIISFLSDMQGYLFGLGFEITEDNFEDYMFDAITETMSKRAHVKLRDALLKAYPGAVVDGMDGIISPEFEPLVETVKIILFSGEDEPEEETTEEEDTEPTTEPKDEETRPTEPVTEPTEGEAKPTEPVTEPAEGEVKPTEPVTEPTEGEVKPTEPATEPVGGEVPTEPKTEPVGGGETGGPMIDEDEVTVPDEGATQRPIEKSFSDMNQAPWAEKAIYALYDMGIINGYPDKTFKPNNPVTRAEFAKIITLASGRYQEKDKAAYVSAFWDVPQTQWHYSYVSAALKFGFIKGRSQTIFDPESNITRADLCLIVYRYVKSINPEFKAKTNPDGSAITFADASLVPVWDAEAVNALYSTGVAPLRDTVNNKFEPTLPATRAECALIVYNALRAALGM